MKDQFYYTCNHCDYEFKTHSKKVWMMKIRLHNEKTHNLQQFSVEINQPRYEVEGTNLPAQPDPRTKHPILSRQHELKSINQS